MNFYELFEKKENKDSEKYQDVSIADPKAAYALRQARAKYTYADSDLEAFVKMTQDKEEEEDKEIEKLEQETDRQEKEINALSRKERLASAEFTKLEKENELQDKSIALLSAKEKEYEKMARSYSNWAKQIGDELTDLERRLAKANVQGFESPRKLSTTPEIPPAPEIAIDLPPIAAKTSKIT